MPKRSKIATLPPAVKEWFDHLLIERNFSGYERLTAEANQKLAKLGYELRFGKSSAGRYGKNLERKLQAIKDSTAAARLIADEAPDDADERSSALTALTQVELFNVVLAIRELDGETDLLKRAKLLSALTGNISKLTRSSVYQKKHMIEIRGKARAAADAAAKIAKKGGLSKDAVDTIRREILGIAAA